MYLNESRLGLVCARLRGDYAVTRDDRVDLKFENLVVKVGPFQAAKKVIGLIWLICHMDMMSARYEFDSYTANVQQVRVCLMSAFSLMSDE